MLGVLCCGCSDLSLDRRGRAQAEGRDLEYKQCYRVRMQAALQGHGRPPSSEELADFTGLHQEWWADRDRIVLLAQYIADFPPDGSYHWELCVCLHALDLWCEGREGEAENGSMMWREFAHVRAPGWRMLTSHSSCPNHNMRFPAYTK